MYEDLIEEKRKRYHIEDITDYLYRDDYYLRSTVTREYVMNNVEKSRQKWWFSAFGLVFANGMVSSTYENYFAKSISFSFKI